MLPEYALTLACHPETPIPVARSVRVRLKRNPGGVLEVSYAIEGDLQGLRIPSAQVSQSPCREPRLWEHTCCEMFIACAGLPGYHELNFSPSGEWAMYVFERYRERKPLSREGAAPCGPRLAVSSTRAKLEIDVGIGLQELSPG